MELVKFYVFYVSILASIVLVKIKKHVDMGSV